MKVPEKETEKRLEIRKAIAIPSAYTDSLKADLYLPVVENRNSAGVLLVFGGSWHQGDRSQQKAYGLALAKAGFTCLACDYRLSSVATWPAQNQDISAAAQWLRSAAAELGIDPGRIGISGNSSGGHLALMAAGRNDYWRNDWSPAAVCAFYPPTRLSPPNKPGHDESFLQLLGQDASDESYMHASPVNLVHGQFPPTLLIVGDADTRVPAEDTWCLYQALKQAGVSAELHSFAGLEHAFDMQREMAVICAAIMIGFFRRYLQK